MTEEFVQRLREAARDIQWEMPLAAERESRAADLLEAQQAEIERLRAAGDELVASLTPVSFAGPHEDMNRLERAYLAWEEARRG